MKLIGINFVVSLIFYSFNGVFVSSWVYKMFMGIDWLLSDYHNKRVKDGVCQRWSELGQRCCTGVR